MGRVNLRMKPGRSCCGGYEVLGYESTPELRIGNGGRPLAGTGERVCYLQGNAPVIEIGTWSRTQHITTTTHAVCVYDGRGRTRPPD